MKHGAVQSYMADEELFSIPLAKVSAAKRIDASAHEIVEFPQSCKITVSMSLKTKYF